MGRNLFRSGVLRLVEKDLRVGRPYLWYIGPFYLVYGLMFFVTSHAFVFVNGLIIFFAAIGLVLIESRYRSDVLFCSLPLKRSAIVLGRYLSSLALGVSGAVVCVAYGTLLLLLRVRAEPAFDLPALLVGAVSLLYWSARACKRIM